MFIVTMEGFTPPPRYDGKKWINAIIQEAPAEDGPWEQLEIQALVPLDADPENPLTRNFTTEQATIEVGGWYRIVFTDLDGDVGQPTQPLQNIPPEVGEYYTTVTEVANKILGRTCNDLGVRQGTFNDDTTPTDEECEKVIEDAALQVGIVIGTQVPDSLLDMVKEIVALRAAMLIELEFYGSEVANNRSAYPQLKELYDELWGQFIGLMQWVDAGGDPDEYPGMVETTEGEAVTGSGMAMFGFPEPDDLWTKAM